MLQRVEEKPVSQSAALVYPERTQGSVPVSWKTAPTASGKDNGAWWRLKNRMIMKQSIIDKENSIMKLFRIESKSFASLNEWKMLKNQKDELMFVNSL